MGKRPHDPYLHTLGAALDAASTSVQSDVVLEIAPQIFSSSVLDEFLKSEQAQWIEFQRDGANVVAYYTTVDPEGDEIAVFEDGDMDPVITAALALVPQPSVPLNGGQAETYPLDPDDGTCRVCFGDTWSDRRDPCTCPRKDGL